MMKLQNMLTGLSGHTVAKQLIHLWEHDEGSLQFWRASSNFVYAFTHREKKLFLRFVHEQEKSAEKIQAELDFLHYLQSKDYPCAMPVPSRTGAFIETITTNEGTYVAAVFRSAEGHSLDESISEHLLKKWGHSLALLHDLSRTYQPADVRRQDWQDALHFIDSQIQQHPEEQEAREELRRVAEWLHSLPSSPDQYGLIHFDFQLDNIFYDDLRDSFDVIDFDDAMYHWFALDIVNALRDFLDQDEEFGSSRQLTAFLRGYRSTLAIDDGTVRDFPLFLRFSRLYSFARLLWSLENSEVVDAPPWYDRLRLKLVDSCQKHRERFPEPWN